VRKNPQQPHPPYITVHGLDALDTVLPRAEAVIICDLPNVVLSPIAAARQRTPRMRGSMASRSPSPNRLNPSTLKKIASPGKTET